MERGTPLQNGAGYVTAFLDRSGRGIIERHFRWPAGGGFVMVLGGAGKAAAG